MRQIAGDGCGRIEQDRDQRRRRMRHAAVDLLQGEHADRTERAADMGGERGGERDADLERVERQHDQERGERGQCGELVQALDAAGPSPQRSIVGREREKTMLRAALGDVEAGRGLLCVVSGDAGIGKTTLVEEFGRDVSTAGIAYAAGRCSEGSRSRRRARSRCSRPEDRCCLPRSPSACTTGSEASVTWAKCGLRRI